jgi:hypothetical protein
MANFLHDFFKKEKDLEKYVENAMAEQDQAVMRLSQQRRLIYNTLESISMLLSNHDIAEFTDNRDYVHLTKSKTILEEWLKRIDRQIDLI